MNRENFRQRLKDGEIVLGCAVGIAHPIAIEAAGYAGFDFVFLDTEHSALDISAIEPMILAARATGVAAIYRLRNHDPAAIGRALDIGAHGIATGVPPESPEEVSALTKLGCQFFESCSAQGVLAEGLQDIVQRSREASAKGHR